MKRYIQHPQTGKLIPRDEYQQESRKTSWQVLPDIQPYISQIDGHIVPSRNAHRAHLRINGCVEVGNEQQRSRPRDTPLPGLKDTIIRVANEKLRYN